MTPQITELLEKLKRERFYGTVALQFKGGHLDLIRKEETIKPKQEGNTRYDFNER